ncbi:MULTISPECIES: GIVxVP protein [unclassified Synechococcus]|uniref:GIVxVP protein n=1 Tax=unclassified Synechococcus TaxID=2626047 RepID=UPI0028F44B2F|nr:MULTISPECIES: GIVxVP protein [unclassified Synechococcus]
MLVPTLLLGGAFLSAALWNSEGSEANRPLALAIAAVLLAGGLFTQLLPEAKPEAEPVADQEDNSDD